MKLVRENLEDNEKYCITFVDENGLAKPYIYGTSSDKAIVGHLASTDKIGYMVVEDKNIAYEIYEAFWYVPTDDFAKKFEYVGRKFNVKYHSPYKNTIN